MLDVPAGVQLRVTKRDCKTWFDQLAVNDDIGDFFGRPRVSRAELLDDGLSADDIVMFGGLAEQDSLCHARGFGRWVSLGLLVLLNRLC